MIQSHSCGYFSELWRLWFHLCFVLCFGTPPHASTASSSWWQRHFVRTLSSIQRTQTCGLTQNAHYLLAHHSLLRRWRPCSGRPVRLGMCLSLCTTVGRYGEYLSSQHLKRDSTDQNNSPRWFPSCAFFSHCSQTQASRQVHSLFCVAPLLSFLTTTLFFLLTLFSHINGTTRVYMVHYIHYMQLEIELVMSLRLFLDAIP